MFWHELPTSLPWALKSKTSMTTCTTILFEWIQLGDIWEFTPWPTCGLAHFLIYGLGFTLLVLLFQVSSIQKTVTKYVLILENVSRIWGKEREMKSGPKMGPKEGHVWYRQKKSSRFHMSLVKAIYSWLTDEASLQFSSLRPVRRRCYPTSPSSYPPINYFLRF